ncbi:MAG: 4-(cytidine 5'-diphospho)-2-C-methyl-D-erythritol kinase [Limisphaerales bacterium]
MLETESFCKVNLLLNILGKRPDGFHELETILQPVHFCDGLIFERGGAGIDLKCSDSRLPVNSKNLVFRAAALFFEAARIPAGEGVRIRLRKRIPLAAGLGGGSGNAAVTLRAMNELFDQPLSSSRLTELAASLGSDVPFFLQTKPALAVGKGEAIKPLDYFPALQGLCWVLVYPGFGVSTPWAYEHLAGYPSALHGTPGRADRLVSLLQTDLAAAASEFYNSLEAPVLRKYPLLALFQEFFREQGALATLMSGSGSTTFALAKAQGAAETMVEGLKGRFGVSTWTAIVNV